MGDTGSRPLVMGILNATPDSFYDGGRVSRPADAIALGREMVAQGADVVDVGGESSRPGALPVPEEEELARVVPVVEGLAGETRISIDTVKPAVARAAVAAGATLVNDVSATLSPVAADLGVGWLGLHMQGTPPTMQEDPRYVDVVAEVHEMLLSRARDARAQGVPEVWVDPGIGFGKTVRHNLSLLAHLGELAEAAAREGCGVAVGTSRKGFLGRITRPPGAEPLDADQRLEGSLATAVWCMTQGVRMVRVHDVAATVDAAKLVGPFAGPQATAASTVAVA